MNLILMQQRCSLTKYVAHFTVKQYSQPQAFFARFVFVYILCFMFVYTGLEKKFSKLVFCRINNLPNSLIFCQ